MNDVNKIKVDLLKLKRGDLVLDVGCSYGEQALMLAEQNLKVTGIDRSAKLITKFNKLTKQKKLTAIGIKADIKKMPFKDNYFDGVIATEILEHVPDPEIIITEIYRVLKENGRICVSVPTSLSEKIFGYLHIDWVKNSGHVNIFSEKKILEMLTDAGFKVLKIEKQNFEWSVFWLIHSIFQTDFDDTGAPKENYIISRIYFKIWKYLGVIGINRYLLFLGNMIFPKSVYIYLVKP